MSKIEHTYIPLTKGTIIHRRHSRDVEPPGMVDIVNFLPSRSDDTLSLRPDFWYTPQFVYGVSSVLTLPPSSLIRDVLNSANGLYGSNQVTYFTTYVPYGSDNGTFRILSGTHNDGTVSGGADSNVVTGSGTSFLEKAYRGAILRVGPVYDDSLTGGFYLWTVSASGTDEYYMTTVAGTTPALLGTGITDVTYYGNFGVTPDPGIVGSLANGEWAYGDNDTLGFNTVYCRNSTAAPEDDVDSDRYLALIETGINVSGAKHYWTASGSGTNEYYARVRGAGNPGIPTNTVVDTTGTAYYYTANGSDAQKYSTVAWYRRQALAFGTAGSLANYEVALGDTDTLGYTTVYLRDNTADPDTTKSTYGLSYTVSIPCQIDYTGASYKFTPSAAYLNTYYLQASGGGTPGLAGSPSSVTVDGTAGTYDATPDSDNEWYYGDLDSLGYNTVYVYRSDGNPDATGKVILGKSTLFIDGSPYKWTVSPAKAGEYYLEASGGGTPSLTQPNSVTVQAATYTKGTLGLLGTSQWGWGDNDTLGYNTIYIKSANDPDTYAAESSTGITFASGVLAQYQYRVYNSPYKWTASGSGTNEYYVELIAGGDPSLTEPVAVYIAGTAATEGTVGSLNNLEWDWGDNDTLGYDTLYIRYNAADPDGAAGTGTASYTTLPATVTSLDAGSGLYDYYIVDNIESDTSLTTYGEVSRGFSSVTPQFYYNHNPFLSNYKLNIQAYTAGLIYCAPTIRDDLNEEDISGPFYADLEEGEWAYGGSIAVDPDFAGSGVLFEKNPSLAANGIGYIQIFPTIDDTGDTGQPTADFLGYAGAISNNAWTKILTSNMTITGDATDLRFNSIQSSGSTYICAAQILTGAACYPGVAYSTSPHIGATWAGHAITTIGGNSTAWADPTADNRSDDDYQAVSAAWSGVSPGRIVCLVQKASANSLDIMYSDDSGATWSSASIDGGGGQFNTLYATSSPVVRYIDGQFVVIGDYDCYYGNGAAFTQSYIENASGVHTRDVAFNGTNLWVAVDEDFTVYYTSALTSAWTKVALPLNYSTYNDQTNHIIYDTIGERFVIGSALVTFWSEDGITWVSEVNRSYGETGLFKRPSNMVADSGGVYMTMYDGGADKLRQLVLSRFNYTFWNIIDFVPLSDIYRASTFSVLDGYVVLLGTREYSAGAWTRYPRRIRWTAPATYNDFSSTGAGTADANGEGAFLDSRPVNGRIVAFETNRVSAIVPRGDVTDPWDYDVVKEDFRILSNPVTVDDLCYIIGTDGLLYGTDGINVTETGSSFDASKFDDFEENKPWILDYSRLLNSLIAYRFDQTDDDHYAYLISLSSGAVTSVKLPELSDSGSLAEKPGFITAVSDSSDQSVIVSYHPLTAFNDAITTMTLSPNKTIIGEDVPQYGSLTQNSYWYGTIETGEIYLVKEGEKTALKHIILRTYTDATVGDNSDRARVVVFYRSLEDTAWKIAGHADSSESTATMTTTAMTDDAGVWSSYIGAGDDSTVDFNLPTVLDGAKVDVYLKAGSTYTKQTYGTDYTIPVPANAYAIRFTTAPTSSQTVYYGWNNKPEIVMADGDLWSAPDGLHRVTSITDHGALALDHYGAATYTGAGGDLSHYPSTQLPAGDGEVKIGLRGLVEGVRFKILVVPEYNTTDCPTTVKVTGITIGHSPMGRKILSATGS